MPRFTDDQLKQLKSDISLVRLIESQGHELKKEGKDHVMCCPFHEDTTPSLKISADKNVFHCFGCGASGTVIDWVMKTHKVSFRKACETLAADAGMAMPTDNSACPIGVGVSDAITLAQAVGYYHRALASNADAMAYLKSRGLDNAELIEHFNIGCADRTLGYHLPSKTCKDGIAVRKQLHSAGILRKSGHEHFNGSIVVPVCDHLGNVTEVYGRKIRNNLRKGTPMHLYLPGAHVGVFNAQGLRLDREVILCESIIDALTFWVNGYHNVTCSYGTGGFTDDILQAFKDHNIRRVLIAYDRDKAGNDAALKLSKKLNAEGFDTYRILFPKDMDANDYALSVTPAQQSLGAVIRKAEWMGNGIKTEAEPAQKPSSTEAFSYEVEPVAEEDDYIYPLAADELVQPPSARAVPKAADELEELQVEVSQHEIDIIVGSRSYRVRGMAKNMSYEQLKVNLLICIKGVIYIDTIDLYHAKSRAGYIKNAAIELNIEPNIIKKDLGKILLKLELIQDEQINGVLNKDKAPAAPSLSEAEYIEAMELLKSPDLLKRITSDLTASGIIGEDVNKLTGYLACVSRKLDRPLAIIIQSTSAAGKSSLMDAILNLMPEEELTQYSAMTGQSLFYMGETNLKNRILAIAEEEGAQNASYALKLLQSEGQLTIASTGKDESTGTMETKEYHVEGPVMLFMTTTAIDIDEELMNRCLVLTVNESREQTQAIHAMQRSLHTIDGILAKQSKNKLIQLHKNMQRLIKPMLVANPYAEQLTFINDKTRTRRDHMKYLTLINSIALLHQYQREIKTIKHEGEVISYIEVEKQDIAIANKLAHEILGRSLDELPPQTRKLLNQIYEMVRSYCKREGLEQCDYLFSRKTVRDATGWGNTQLKVHLDRLEDMEYILAHKGGRGQSFAYELLYQNEGKDGNNFVLGLKDMQKLDYDAQLTGSKDQDTVSKRGQNAPKTGSSRSSKTSRKANNHKASSDLINKNADKALLAAKKIKAQSHRNAQEVR